MSESLNKYFRVTITNFVSKKSANSAYSNVIEIQLILYAYLGCFATRNCHNLLSIRVLVLG